MKSQNNYFENSNAAKGNQAMRGKSILRQSILAALVTMGGLGTAQAIEFGEGEFTGSWDTTLSYGASWRVEDRCQDCVGKSNIDPLIFTRPLPDQIAAPGRFSINSDNGNLNYDDGDLISHAVKLTTEVGFSYKNFGGFFRGSAFYDFENEDNDFLEVANDRFGAPLDYVGSDARLLDAFLYYDFDIGEKPGTIRLGRQVVSWGESTFIQGGINTINPVDVSKLRVAGAELKEAFLPIDMVWTSFDLTQNLSFEALYMFEFEQIDPDPDGSYFSTNDFGTIGGDYAMLGFGLFPEQFPGLTIPRTNDNSPDDSGQYGFALRYYSSELNDTEFGLFYLNYHSRLPLISGNAITEFGTTAIGTPDFSSGRYFIEYPEDIELWGVSFNTEIAGIAFAGEVSYRDNVPLQIDDVEVLFAALSPVNGLIPEPFNQFRSQLGNFAPGQYIQGWERHELSQAQMTVTKIFGPGNPFRADQVVVLGEFGMTKVWDLPDHDVLRYQGPGTDTGGGPSALNGGNSRNPVTLNDGFPTSSSWGYRLISRLDYNSAFGTAINLFPRFAFNHDVNGTSPGPGGSFVEDRKSMTLGLGGTYLEKWGADIAYTRFWGGGQFNLLRDRDFVGVSLRYSF